MPAHISQKQAPLESLVGIGGMMKMKYYVKRMLRYVRSRVYQGLNTNHYQLLGDKSVARFKEKEDLQNIQNRYLFDLFLCMKNCWLSRNLKKYLEKLPVFDPSHPFKFVWDFLQVISIIAFFFFIPIHIIFQIQMNNLVSLHLLELAP